MDVAERTDRHARVIKLDSLKATSNRSCPAVMIGLDFDQTIGGSDSDGRLLPSDSAHAMVGSHFPGTITASSSPGHGGMVIATAVSGSSSKERNWK